MTLKKIGTLSFTALALIAAPVAFSASAAQACDAANCPHKAKGDKSKACDCGKEDCKGKDCPYGKKGGHGSKAKKADAAAPAPAAPAAEAEKPAAH